MGPLVFGAGPVALHNQRSEARQQVERLLEAAVGRRVTVEGVPSYGELLKMSIDGHADFSWLPPALFVRAEAQGVTLLLGGVRQFAAQYSGAIFVRTDDPAKRAEDLAGRSIAWVDKNSCAGYLFPRLALQDRGLTPSTHFSTEEVLGSHGAVTRAVAVGEVDAGANFIAVDRDGGIMRAGWALEVDAQRMRPILLSEPIPADTICAGSRVDKDLRNQFAMALGEMHTSSEGCRALIGLFGVDRFEPTLPTRYDSVRRAGELAAS